MHPRPCRQRQAASAGRASPVWPPAERDTSGGVRSVSSSCPGPSRSTPLDSVHRVLLQGARRVCRAGAGEGVVGRECLEELGTTSTVVVDGKGGVGAWCWNDCRHLGQEVPALLPG